MSVLASNGATACTFAPWAVEERVLHIASGIGGPGDRQNYFPGGGRPAQPMAVRDPQTLLDVAAAASGGATSLAPVTCDCSCPGRAALSPIRRAACQPQCRAAWAACPSN